MWVEENDIRNAIYTGWIVKSAYITCLILSISHIVNSGGPNLNVLKTQYHDDK